MPPLRVPCRSLPPQRRARRRRLRVLTNAGAERSGIYLMCLRFLGDHRRCVAYSKATRRRLFGATDSKGGTSMRVLANVLLTAMVISVWVAPAAAQRGTPDPSTRATLRDPQGPA